PADTAGTTATVIYKETVKDDEIFMSWLGSITGEYPDSIKLNEFTAGKEVPFTIPAAMIKGNEGGTVEVKYEIERAAGGTSYSDTLKFSVGVALDLKAPKIKEAPNDSSLDPLNAQNTLTAVIDYDGMLVGDKIIVKWTGAPGTLPAGSHTTDPWPVTRVGPQEIPLDVSVIAFNLDKSITLDYAMTRGTQEPKDSQIRTLAVLQLRVDLSHSPKIIQAAGGGNGTELDVSTLTAAATLRGGFWPHIASGQRVWMEVQGTKKDDTEYKRVVWRGPSNAVNGTWISQGYLDASLPLADLQSLKDLSPLNVSFMATPDRSTDENLALSFPVRTYTVKNVVEVLPTIESIKESPGGEEIPHGSPTVKTAVTLSGKATPGKKIDLANNGAVMPNTEIQVDSKGEWTFQLTGLVVGNTYKLSARRKDGTPSNTRNVVVVALVVPTLDNVLDDKGIEVPDRQFTVSTQLKLKGTASYGQEVEIFEGNGPSHTSKGVATASTTTGIWELSITVAVGARRLYAGSLYTPSLQWSNVRTLTVTEATAPTLDNVLDDKGVVVPKNTNTLSTSLTLKGSASIGQNVEIFDGTTSIGEVTATSGIWEKLITGLSLTSHTFTAKAVYGSGAVSTAWKVTVQAFTLDRSPMNLNGLCLILDPSNSPRWKKSGVVEPGTTQTRRPTVAAEPVSYASSNPSIASVDSSGKITSVNKGKSIITVTDARLNSGTYEVNVTNVHRITIRRGTVTSAQGNAWIASVGGINGGEYVMHTLQRLCSNDGELGTHYTGSTRQFYSLTSLSTQALLLVTVAGSDLSRDSAVAMIPV
ncbi:Ig-like domain-containing protein, partial [Pseudomonas sp. rhizo66]|uniref:Ig-like domain-containing protein n=1 Tax=Pseudomonas sp. rhizo66 TaxID=3059674 RepID=UPI00288F6766